MNEAARDKLYFDRLRATDEELARRGVPFDEKLYQQLNKWVNEHLARKGSLEVRDLSALE